MNERKFQLANIVDKYVKGKMKRRDFVRSAAMLGLGAGALGLGSRYGLGGLMPKAHAADIEWRGDMMSWLKDVSAPFKGQTVKLATESTPPSNAINSTLKPFFASNIPKPSPGDGLIKLYGLNNLFSLLMCSAVSF